MQQQREVTVSVTGAGALQGFGSADPITENYYDCPTWTTYDGCLLAAVRAGREPGKISVTFTAEGCADKTVKIIVE